MALILAPIYLGATFIEAYQKLDLAHVEQIKQQVTAQLAETYTHRDNRQRLKTAIVEEVTRIKQEECYNDPKNPAYQKFNDGGKAAVKIIKS
jgi:hypothetical protein